MNCSLAVYSPRCPCWKSQKRTVAEFKHRAFRNWLDTWKSSSHTSSWHTENGWDTSNSRAEIHLDFELLPVDLKTSNCSLNHFTPPLLMPMADKRSLIVTMASWMRFHHGVHKMMVLSLVETHLGCSCHESMSLSPPPFGRNPSNYSIAVTNVQTVCHRSLWTSVNLLWKPNTFSLPPSLWHLLPDTLVTQSQTERAVERLDRIDTD